MKLLLIYEITLKKKNYINIIMNTQQTEHITFFLNKCNIITNNLTELHGLTIPREIFLDKELYNSIKEDILGLKQIFTSSSLTGLQSNAEDNQKWPLLNLVRQVLRSCNYNMNPRRVSAGYTKDGKKIYKRMFIIEKIKPIIQSQTEPGPESVFTSSDS